MGCRRSRPSGSISKLALSRELCWGVSASPSDVLAGAALGVTIVGNRARWCEDPRGAGRPERWERGRVSTRSASSGMPNAGKSSLFNALTKAGAEAANYPFTTIEPNVAVVPVRDERLEQVARRSAPRRSCGTRWTSTTSRARGRSASGRGPRQQFLANIRETHAIVHVVRRTATRT